MWAQLSFVLSQITRLIDGQTVGQTDSFLVASPRWHSMQRDKKCTVIAQIYHSHVHHDKHDTQAATASTSIRDPPSYIPHVKAI